MSKVICNKMIITICLGCFISVIAACSKEENKSSRTADTAIAMNEPPVTAVEQELATPPIQEAPIQVSNNRLSSGNIVSRDNTKTQSN